MQLMVDGVLQMFTEIKPFRVAHDLPDTFRVSYFEPKDYTGLGRMDHAGAELNALRHELLERLPSHKTTANWLIYAPTLTQLFRDRLEAINHVIGLREPEVGFAAAGFGDICQEWIYALIHAEAVRKPAPAFEQVYASWLFSTVRVSQYVFNYAYNAEDWKIQMITHAYGRVGMLVKTSSQNYYVYDASLACPAEGYMQSLLHEVADFIAADIGIGVERVQRRQHPAGLPRQVGT